MKNELYDEKIERIKNLRKPLSKRLAKYGNKFTLLPSIEPNLEIPILR